MPASITSNTAVRSGVSQPRVTLSVKSAAATLGDTIDFGSAHVDVTCQVFATATLTGGTVMLQVSMDGKRWVNANSVPLDCTGITTGQLGASETNAIFNSTQTVPSGAWRYARVNIVSGITGGSISVYILAAAS